MTYPSQLTVSTAAHRAANAAGSPLLLAVSGGLDSMALLVAMAQVAPERVAAVATFDHGTGPAATAASEHVREAATRLGLRVITGRGGAGGRAPDGWEAEWRRARYAFLRSAAAGLGARVATAHSADDQVETVLMRVLRGSGTRGLAGLAARSPIVRPFLHLRRRILAEFLADSGQSWVEDPGNESRAHLRNRVRHDLLPALRGVDPGIDATLLGVGQAAARWRARMEELVDGVVRSELTPDGGLSVASAELRGYDRDSLAIMWGTLAGRAGLALDRRGTQRLAAFTMNVPVRGSMPLSGGWCLEARSSGYHLSRGGGIPDAPAALSTAGMVQWGRFRFRAMRAGEPASGDAWSAWVPDVPGVRAWAAGDRLGASGGQPPRRVARYLSDAGVHGLERATWPVVVSGAGEAGEVVWIPGVRRSDAATERSGRPVLAYACERIAP